MEPAHRLRHLPFFEAIASSDEGDAEWHAATAGLVVLRLVDSWIEDGSRVLEADEWALRSVRVAIDEVRSREKLRTILFGILEVLETAAVAEIAALAPRMMAYGQLLEYDSRWSLAEDVYTTVASHTHPAQEADVASQAHLRRGFCLRQMGELDRSLVAYETAGEIARAANDMVGVLRARIGEAKAAMARGNMPKAQSILDDTIDQAFAHQLSDVRSMALHDRSVVAHLIGDYELAIKLAYDALSTTRSPRERDRILGDIAGSFYMLGVHSAARDAYLILAATAQEQYQRWFATLNLMEIAAVDGQELLFEQYRRSVDVRALPPELEASYWLQAGSGFAELGRTTQAREFFLKAISFAEEYELNQIAFKADSALRDLGVAERRRSLGRPLVADEDVNDIATRLRSSREEIGV